MRNNLVLSLVDKHAQYVIGNQILTVLKQEESMLNHIETAWSLAQSSYEIQGIESNLRNLQFTQFAVLAFAGLDLEVKKT